MHSLALTHANPNPSDQGAPVRPSLHAVAAGLRRNNPGLRELTLQAAAFLCWGDPGVAEVLDAVAANTHLRRLSWRAHASASAHAVPPSRTTDARGAHLLTFFVRPSDFLVRWCPSVPTQGARAGGVRERRR